MTATVAEPMTSEQLFALRPKKNLDRWLFRGELRESKVTKRNPSHSKCVSKVSFTLTKWLMTRPKPRGEVFSGEAYFRIRKDPDTNVGIDVALATPEQVAKTTKKDSFVDGPPVLAVEILSPYDRVKDIDEAIEEYLECGVKVVWILDPYRNTATVHRRGEQPVAFNMMQEISGEPELPGFKCSVGELFE
jgi:Uma2 family endonuclease